MNPARREVLDEFRACVSMPPKALEDWLETEESRSVGARSNDCDESVGHASGRCIVELLRTRIDNYGDADYAHMPKVVGYVHRHLAQRPSCDVEDTRWRHSLMNWGHDPLRH